MRTPACALTSLLSSLQPPRSDSPVSWQPPTLSSSTPPATLLPHFTYNLASPSLSHLLFLFFAPPPTPFPHLSLSTVSLFSSPTSFFRLVFISRPLICRVGLPCLSSCSLRPLCCLSLSLWKPRMDRSGSEVCETLIQTLLDHRLTLSPREPHARRLTCMSASLALRVNG